MEPTDPGVTGGDGEESVDDILKQLNAIKLADDPTTKLGDPDKVVNLMEEGNTLVQKGDPAGALAKYREALEFADGEGDPDVFFNMGIAHKVSRPLADMLRDLESVCNGAAVVPAADVPAADVPAAAPRLRRCL